MTTAPTLNRFARIDKPTGFDGGDWIRWMNLDDEKSTEIERAFAEIIADQVTIAAVQTALDGKNSIFRATSAPTATATGDLWLDSDDGDKPYRWDGASWVAVQDIGAAYARLGVNSDGTIKADKVVNSSVLAGEVLGAQAGYTAGTTNISSGGYTYTQVASQSFTSAGGQVRIACAALINVIDNCKYKFRLKCDTAVVGDEVGPITVSTSDQVPLAFTWAHTPASGAHTYTLEVACNDAGDINVVNPLIDPFENRNT